MLILPPYISLAGIFVGVVWLFLLPLNQYSRNTYVSENALLPGQVHTYFGGSEHDIFRAYRQEVALLEHENPESRAQRIREIFQSAGLKTASQKYSYSYNGGNASGVNAYAILQGPRADATEAVALIAAWRTYDGQINYSGVALVLTLARYFKRWSLWSKDIIFLIPEDSVAGPQAWADAYHDTHDPAFVHPLPIKSGALQGAVAVEYPAGAWGQRFDKLHIRYDGTNGQLPNLDLFNTAVSVASGQMGIGCTLQRMWKHDDTYLERLQTMLRGMLNQGLGHATGPHSALIPYHVDAITLQTIGDGWQDEMSLGRALEGIFRSLNNLLEHLHQSFFFYLLTHVNRFISIGTYLPSAMLIAGSFTVMSIFLWLGSGWRIPKRTSKYKASTNAAPAKDDKASTELLKHQPKDEGIQPVDRKLFVPFVLITSIHFLALIPLALFNHSSSPRTFLLFTILALPSPILLAFTLPTLIGRKPMRQEHTILLSFSLLLLGMFLSALATLNFSLSFIIGVLGAPLAFTSTFRADISTKEAVMEDLSGSSSYAVQLYRLRNWVWMILLLALSPMTVVWLASSYFMPGGLEELLRQAGFGWLVCGLWTQVVVWLVWFPSWWVGVYVIAADGLFGISESVIGRDSGGMK